MNNLTPYESGFGSIYRQVTTFFDARRQEIVSQVAQLQILIPFMPFQLPYLSMASGIGIAMTSDMLKNYPPGPSRDILVLWEALGSKIGVPVSFLNLGELSLSAQFTQWINKNRQALNKVDTLDLQGQGLTTLPPHINRFPNLRVLDISHNQLTVLTPEIGRLRKLRFLDASSNKLKELPSEIGRLDSLHFFDASNNKLNELPSEICQLSNLCFLFISNNLLTALPLEMGHIKELRRLFVNGNPITTIPDSLAFASDDCRVHFEQTALSGDVIQKFKEFIRYIRQTYPYAGPRLITSLT